MSDAFAPAAAAGVHRLAIPTPFAVGRVNVYLIEDEPLTLVDAGPNSGRSLDELESQLSALGHRVEDIGLILVTHQHIDHIGLVSIVARRSGADVACIDRLVPFIENYSEAMDSQDLFSTELMLRHGISADVVQALRAVSVAFRAWGSGGSGSRQARMSASTSSRFSSMCCAETSDSRLSRSSGSVFEGRTLKCQSG